VMEMCVDNPREGFGELFDTHPSVAARVAALVKFAGGHDPGPIALPPPGSGANDDQTVPAGPWNEPRSEPDSQPESGVSSASGTAGDPPGRWSEPAAEPTSGAASGAASGTPSGPWGPHRN
jgi:heat shock protein HtpX